MSRGTLQGQHASNVVSLLIDPLALQTQKDLAAAEEIYRLTFESYHENTISQALTGVKLTDFQMVVERLAKQYHLPEREKGAILDGEFADHNVLKFNEFSFNIPDSSATSSATSATTSSASTLRYCKVATIKTSDTKLDLAILAYDLDFKLVPRRIETETRNYLLGVIPWGTTSCVTYEDRAFTEEEQDKMINFFRAKAIQGFLQDNPTSAIL